MPIGASKVGALGGLVPGGSVTFNASGTWDVPPGVKIVSITGVGGTGNPGIAGNPGNPGNPGSGGAGAGGGRSLTGVGCAASNNPGGRGGIAARPDMITRGTFNTFPSVPVNPFYPAGTAPPTYINQLSIGGLEAPTANPTGQAGQGGNAGTAGQAGQPGNTGQASSGLCNTFPGGAGGNAGVAGNAGTAGTGGGGASGGNSANETSPPNPGTGGSGGTGGGNGGNGNTIPSPNPLGGGVSGGRGGGGAGATNSGSSGQPGRVIPQVLYARGGNDAQVSAPVNANCPFWYNSSNGCPQSTIPTNIMGGSSSFVHGTSSIRFSVAGCQIYQPGCTKQPGRVNLPQFSPLPLAPNIIRAGAGGGRAGITNSNNIIMAGGGGGGGGGRGNAGNAGGPAPTPSGQAATPLTFNCVPVTPGTPTPITVGSPGGQIVISWNPQ